MVRAGNGVFSSNVLVNCDEMGNNLVKARGKCVCITLSKLKRDYGTLDIDRDTF